MNPNDESTCSPRRGALPRAALVALALLCASPAALAETPGDAVVRQLSGDVELGRGEPPSWQPLREGDRVKPSDRIRTGADGRVEITMAAGTLRVHENSLLRLPASTAETDRVDLERGHSLFDVLRRAGRRFEVHTPTVVVSVKGTRFGVDAGAETGAVAVYHGLVGVRTAGVEQAIETLVREGFVASGGAGRPIELDVAPAGDPWAAWQDFRNAGLEERPGLRTRLGDVERARRTLHRATGAEVLRRAAERKPEVAERLRRLRLEREAGGSALPTTPDADAMPAAPAPDGEGMDPRPMMMRRMMQGDPDMAQQQMQRARQMQAEAMMDAMREAMEKQEGTMSLPDMGSGGTSNDPTLSAEDIYQLDPTVRMDVVEVLQGLPGSFQAAGQTTPPTTQEVESMITSELLTRGYDPETAAGIASGLLNP